MLAWRMTDRQQLRRFCIDLLRSSHTFGGKNKKESLLWKNRSAFVVPPPSFPIKAPYKFLHSRILSVSEARLHSNAWPLLKGNKKNLVEQDLKYKKQKNHLPKG